MPKQVPLPLIFADDFDQHSFHISSSNLNAVQCIQQCLSAQHGLLIVHGSAGCGKSHLARAIAGQMKREVHHANVGALPVNVTDYILDDMETIRDDPNQQEQFVHCINRLRLAGQGRMVLFSRTHPTEWAKETQLADFISRINGLFDAAEIFEPDDELLRQIFIKLAADRHFTLPDAVVNYWLARMPRSYIVAQGLVQALDQITLAQQSKVSIVTAKQALAGIIDL